VKAFMTVSVAVALAALTGAAFAEGNRIDNDAAYVLPAASDGEVDTSFPVTKAALMEQGYLSVMMTNGNPYHLLATDAQGSEVMLTIDSLTGKMARSEFVHPMDK